MSLLVDTLNKTLTSNLRLTPMRKFVLYRILGNWDAALSINFN
jgi:hypothetical protein